MQDRVINSRSEIFSKLSTDIECLQAEKTIRNVRKSLSSHLYAVFLNFFKHFPQKCHINILSLACGIPDEFIALKVLLQEKNISINFVGVDIDDAHNTYCKHVFKKYEDNLTLLTGDITHPLQLARMMEYRGCLPKDGFDFIILRQPNILLMPKIFKPAILETIPYFSSRDARVFISTYHNNEIQAISQLALNTSDRYAAPGKGNFCDLSGTAMVINERLFYPDHFSTIFKCEGNGLALLHDDRQRTGKGRVFQEVFHQHFFGGLGLKMNRREIDNAIEKEINLLSCVRP